MFTEILSDTAGQAALSRFFTTNTWNAQQIFKGSATTTPGAVFQAFGTTSAIPAIDANGIAIFQGAEAVNGHVQFSASGSTTHVVFRRNNGTYASPTALAANDVIGSLQWQGRGASTFGTVPAAQIRGVAREAFTEAARGTLLEFYVTNTAAITQTLCATMSMAGGNPLLQVDGQILANGANNSIRLNANAGVVRPIFFQSAFSNRWEIRTNSVAEGGSNAGSNLEIRRYSDAAADLGAAISIVRSTGVTTFGANAINITTAQSPATSAAAGTTGDIAWDDTYLYVRMSTGWRRIALGAAF
jgi:hypothetical protein